MSHNGRLRFDAIEMLQQAIGLPTPGYAVITKEFGGALIAEMRRLYELEESLSTPGNVVTWAEFQQLSDAEQAELFAALNYRVCSLDELLGLFPPCPEHGADCIPHIRTWIQHGGRQ